MAPLSGPRRQPVARRPRACPARPLGRAPYGAGAIRDRATRARAAGVALLLEEAGWRGTDASRRDSERALVFGGWLSTAHEEGIGVMPWMIAEPDRTDYDGYLIDVARDSRTVEVLRCE